MILKRFYDDKLAHASWLVGCAATGEALVVDPNRDAEPYVDAAAREGLRITHVAETHIHADFVSGARELAQRTGAMPYLSDEGGDEWRYGWADEAGAVRVKDGSRFMVGNVRVDVMHTPGHTPEHVCFIVTDTAGADRPMGVFTGDFVFVGDVGRPDLLERAAQYAGTMEAGARALFRSLQRFKAALPDWVQLWPAHGAGSACGKSLGAVPSTTLGYEKLFNRGLAEGDEDAFVRDVLAGQPEPPMYFAEMKRVNRDGPRVLGGFRAPRRLPSEQLAALAASGETVVDTRRGDAFAARHVPGTLSVPLGRSFLTWAGSIVPYGRPLWLVVEEECAAGTIRDLAMIGLDDVAGCFPPEAVDAAVRATGRAGSVDGVTADELAGRALAGAVETVDVRNSSEYTAGHLPGAANVPLGRLAEHLGELPRDRTLVVHCQGGARAGVAISLLKARGFSDVVHLQGDFAGWSREGRPVETEAPSPVPTA
ncbi:MBL fold metallo-hydrolase [Longimicrobium sp.]|uniref:MBL fold metallo-hydrolase n=1 Tax=Longimicrobium sp. TaxID=2029185 RepID=UPI002BA1D592|nr:MBL fold metallo-hydrolase [Longimicrobium sp.]HSU16445.1 MBL fold metallo-hydrolase [Longimicrobium sp.]